MSSTRKPKCFFIIFRFVILLMIAATEVMKRIVKIIFDVILREQLSASLQTTRLAFDVICWLLSEFLVALVLFYTANQLRRRVRDI